MRKVEINRERVLGLIKTANVALTTKEMGRILKVKERSVRAAITWLKIGGFIEPKGTLETQTTPSKYGKRKFKVQMYSWTGKNEDICKIHHREIENGALPKTDFGDVVLLQDIMFKMSRG
ncbi:MAG: hypothetical protein WC733_00050 [Methylophilus sp.]|jgi:hypothetical protein